MPTSHRIFFLFVFQLMFVHFNTAYAQKFDKISNQEGFNQNTIKSIEQDLYGFIWFGTPNGLIKYDGYTFKSFYTQSDTANSLKSNYINSIFSDNTGVLWIGSNLGLNVYIPWLEKFYTVPLDKDFSINKIMQGPQGHIWFSGAGKLYTCKVLNVEKGEFSVSESIVKTTHNITQILDFSFKDSESIVLVTTTGLKKLKLNNNTSDALKVTSITEYEQLNEKTITTVLSANGVFWLGTNQGVLKVIFEGDNLHILKDFDFHTNKKDAKPPHISTLLADKSGTVWVGSINQGLFKYDSEDGSFKNFQFDPKNKFGISSNYINALYLDNFEVLWVGTAQGGISKLDIKQKPFINYVVNPYDKYALSDNLITSILEDSNGKLWIAAFNSPLIRSKEIVNKNTVENLKFEDLQKELPIKEGEIIRCIFEDNRGFLWFGSDESLIVYNPKSKRFKKLILDINGVAVIGNSIWNITQIDKNKLLVSGNKVLTLTSPWESIEKSETPSIPVKSVLNFKTERVQTVLKYSQNSYWFGTTEGVVHAHFNNEDFTIVDRYSTHTNKKLRLSYNDVFSLHKEKNNIWIGTFGGGLNKMMLDEKAVPTHIEYYTKKNVLPDDAVYGILPQDSTYIWLSTDMGLVKFKTNDNVVNFFDVTDGLPQNNFRQNAYFKGKSGYFYFGGLNGLTIFKPKDIKLNEQPPEILIANLLVNNKKVVIGEKNDNQIILKKSISEAQSLEINQNNNSIAFNLVVKHTATPLKNRLAYKLEGFNKEWIELNTGKAEVTYTNLSAGDYIFRVKAANGDGIWSNYDRQLNLKILPPWYNTWWSYILFVILVFSIALGIIIYFVRHESLKQKLKYEKKDKERLETINQGKFRYFTNLSHEFRTPLTLIAGPLERLMSDDPSNPKNKTYLSIIQKNTKRLLSLVDQLITFRQAEQGRLNLKLAKTELGEFIYPTTEAFENYALEKNINFFYKVKNPNEEIVTDIEKFERIIFNLLSNAFKNTPAQGNISIEAGITKVSGQKIITIDVIDSGKGISPENLENIFERFYQLGDNVNDVSGGGIGLSFCKSLINLFNGNISVESTEGIETRFSVKIPSKDNEFKNNEDTQVLTKSFIKNWVPLSKDIFIDDRKILGNTISKEYTILVVEDEEGVQNFLYKEFSEKYYVMIAKNGIEALEVLKSSKPNLIISDVMMPEMDGYQLCKKIKSDPELCHIPVLLLTALGEKPDLIKGFEFGADEYISKPFSLKHLELRVGWLIQNNTLIKKHFSKHSDLPKEKDKISLSKRDEKFIQNVIKTIEENISDSTFGVEELCLKIGLSTSHFYRKLKQLTGQVPNVYLRNFRLQRAANLLTSNQGYNVVEVMYQIGIESNSYFSTSFKKLHGVSPSEYKKKQSN